MFRERMKVKESRGEIELLVALKKAGVKNLFYQSPIILKATVPDFKLPDKKIAIYLDGEPHLKNRQIEKDEAINFLLEKLGWTVLRFPYSSPLSEKAKTEIVTKIVEEMAKK